MGSARLQRITGKGEIDLARPGTAAKPRRRRLPATALVDRPRCPCGKLSAHRCWPCRAAAWMLCMPRGRSLAVTHTHRSETHANWQGAYRLPAVVRRPGHFFCRRDAQRLGGARRSDGHASRRCRHAGCQGAVDARRHLRQEKISRPCGWLHSARRPEPHAPSRKSWRRGRASSSVNMALA
jgi:hypothetical protein